MGKSWTFAVSNKRQETPAQVQMPLQAAPAAAALSVSVPPQPQ